MTNIEQFYDKNLAKEGTNFEPFQAIPHIIHMLGRDYTTDTKSVWIATGIFLEIILRCSILDFKPISDVLFTNITKYFEDNCIEYCIKGLADQSFFQIFNETESQLKMMSLLVNFAGKSRAEAMVSFLLGSEMKLEQLAVVLSISIGKKYDFVSEIFSRASAELTLEILRSKEFLESKLTFLGRLCNFVKKYALLPKTNILVIEKVLDSYMWNGKSSFYI